jgi:hypothetical protein
MDVGEGTCVQGKVRGCRGRYVCSGEGTWM